MSGMARTLQTLRPQNIAPLERGVQDPYDESVLTGPVTLRIRVPSQSEDIKDTVTVQDDTSLTTSENISDESASDGNVSSDIPQDLAPSEDGLDLTNSEDVTAEDVEAETAVELQDDVGEETVLSEGNESAVISGGAGSQGFAPSSQTVDLPLVTMVDITPIQAPILRGPPQDSLRQSAQILAQTGSTPSQHHANIQSSLFRLSEVARTAQRTMVHRVESIALNARWSVETMANQIDAIVAACTSQISAAAISARDEIIRIGTQAQNQISRQVSAAQTDLETRGETVRAGVVNALKNEGAAPIRQAHDALVGRYNAHVASVIPKIAPMVEGTEPTKLTGGTPSTTERKSALGPHRTYAAAGNAISADLDAQAATANHVTKYINARKKQVVQIEAAGMATDWRTAAVERANGYRTDDARNRFVMSSFGLVAPAICATEEDQNKYQEGVARTIGARYGNMDVGNRSAIIRIETMLHSPSGVFQALSPSNKESIPAKINHGLTENGKKIKEALLGQALMIQAGMRAGLSDLARNYPNILTRMEAMLDGDDLLDERVLTPKILEAQTSVLLMKEAHIAGMEKQADAAVHGARTSFNQSVQGLMEATRSGLDTMLEQKRKGIFQVNLIGAEFSSYFDGELASSLNSVRGYVEETSRQMLATVRAGDVAHSAIETRVIDHFNGQISGEWEGYVRTVNRLGEALGVAGTPLTAPLPQVQASEEGDLTQRKRNAVAALGVGQQVSGSEVAGAVVGGIAAGALLGGPVGMAGAAAYLGYRYYRSVNPDISRLQQQIALPWPGALAVNERPDPSANLETLIVEKIDADDSERQPLLDQFSNNQETAVAGKANMAINAAGSLFTIDDATVLALSQSFTPQELALLPEGRQAELRTSVVNNLDGLLGLRTTDSRTAEAYLSGNPAQAVLIGTMEDLAVARRGGDAGLQTFEGSLTQRLERELKRGNSTRYVSPHEQQALADNVFLAFDATHSQAKDGSWTINTDTMTASAPANETVTQRAARVAAAREHFAQFATRDYMRMSVLDQSNLDRGLGALTIATGGVMLPTALMASALTRTGVLNLSSGDDRLATYLTGEGEAGGMITREHMSAHSANMLTVLITKGSQSNEYRAAALVQALEVANGRMFDPSEADVVRIHQLGSSSALGLANSRLAQAQQEFDRLPEGPERERARSVLLTATAAQANARNEHDQFLVRTASVIKGETAPEQPTPQQIAAARTLVSGRINAVGAEFDSNLGNMGSDIVTRGQVDFGTGLRVATDGAGTHDALLTEFTANRSRFEMDSYFASAQARNAGISRENLGATNDNHWYSWTETSGDDAFNLLIALEGVPETPAQKAELANRRAHHQLSTGTGLVSGMSMAGTVEKAALQADQAALQKRLKAAIINNPNTSDPELQKLLALPPDQYFDASGRLRPEVSRYAMHDVVQQDGSVVSELYGSGPTIDALSNSITLSSTAYQEEVGRQEAFFTGLITAAALAVTIALMFIPGVNLVVAGIVSALIAGGATMAVKFGFRGGRYGWEEAASDVGRMAIEAATAGAAGALGRGAQLGQKAIAAGEAAVVAGRLANVGARIEMGMARLMGTGLGGKAASAAVREGITSAVSGVANQALDDKIWEKGVDKGLGSLFGAGLRGGVTGMISGGGAEVLTGGMQRLATFGQEGGRMRTFANRFAGNLVVQEALSNAGALVASEAAGALLDVASGQTTESFDQFLKRLGPAALKELLSSASKTAVRGHLKKIYHAERARLLTSDTPPTKMEMQHLHRLAISADEAQYGRQRADSDVAVHGAATHFTDSHSAFAKDFYSHQARLISFGSDVAKTLTHLDRQDFAMIEALRQSATPLDADAHAAMLKQLAQKYPQLDAAKLLDDVAAVMRTDAQKLKAQEAQAKAVTDLRNRLLQDLPANVRALLANSPMDALLALPPEHHDALKALLVHGDKDGAGLATLLAKSNAGEEMGAQLRNLVADSANAAKVIAQQDDARRVAANALLPGLEKAIAALKPREVEFLLRQIHAEGGPSANIAHHLVRMLNARQKDVSPTAIATLVGKAADHVAQNRSAQKVAAIEEQTQRRAAILALFPEQYRSHLAALSDAHLMELHVARNSPEPLHKARIAEMLSGLDHDSARLVEQAIRLAATSPAPRGSYSERFRQRRALVQSVPAELRGLVRQTPIVTLDDAAFAAYVRTHAQDARPNDNAVTIKFGERVVVLMRRGADNLALREEGLHVLQYHDISLRAVLAQVDERRLGRWPELSTGEKLNAWRAVTAAEIDVHLKMKAQLEQAASGAWLDKTKARNLDDLARVSQRLENLHARLAQIDGMSPAHRSAMEAGLVAQFHFLHQPARLFNTDPGKYLDDTRINKWMADKGLAPEVVTPATSAKKAKIQPVELPDAKVLLSLHEKYNDLVPDKGISEKQAQSQKNRIKAVFKAISTAAPEVQNAMLHLLKQAMPVGAELHDPAKVKRARLLILALSSNGLAKAIALQNQSLPGHSKSHQQLVALLLRELATQFSKNSMVSRDERDINRIAADFIGLIKKTRALHPASIAHHAMQTVARFLMVEERLSSKKATKSTAGRPDWKRRALADFLDEAIDIKPGIGLNRRMAWVAKSTLGLSIPHHIMKQLASNVNGGVRKPGDPKGVLRDKRGIAMIQNSVGEWRPIDQMADPTASARFKARQNNYIGRYGEVMADHWAKSQGWVRLQPAPGMPLTMKTKFTGANMIDAIYRNPNPPPGPIVVIDAKARSAGQSTTVSNVKQMSKQWILERLKNTALDAATRKALTDQFKQSTTITSVIIRVDDQGVIKVIYLNNAGNKR